MKVKFLGTGNCARVPVYNCFCKACHRARNVNGFSRQPSCLLITVNEKQYLLDVGISNVENYIDNLSAILISHFHMDHVHGLFHMRWGKIPRVPVYCPDDPVGCADLYKNNGIFDFIKIKNPLEGFVIDELLVTPLLLSHSKITFGYCIEYGSKTLVYLCDTKGLSKENIQFLKLIDIDALIVDCTYPPGFPDAYNHNDLNEAIEIIEKIEAKTNIITHISHDLDCYLMEHSLPENITLAKDLMEFSIEGFSVFFNGE